MKKNKKETFWAYLCSAPSLLLILLIVVFPILYTAYISFTNMNVYHWFNFSFVGLKNYKDALFVFDSGFLAALLRTILWTVLNMVLQLVIMTGAENYTLAAGLYSLQATEMSGSWPVFAAASLVVSLPILIVFFAVQRHMTSGLTAGGVKG